MSLKLPTEIIKDNPGLSRSWTSNNIGHLFQMKLVRGKKKQRRNFIEERDVLRLFSSRIT